MRYLPIAIALTITCLISPAYSQTPSAKLEAAKKQTAIALRAVATVNESSSLARLGDFESARKLAGSRAVAPYIVQDALRKDDFATAEREIKLMGLNGRYDVYRLWLKLSKRYSELNRPADAQRTAFYAVTQILREKNTQQWGDVAEWLCQINNTVAARRFFAIAQRELIISRRESGSSRSYALSVATRCGFDEIALKGPFINTGISLVTIYASKNRDDMARRILDISVQAREAEVEKRLATTKPEDRPFNTPTRASLYSGYLFSLAEGQISRGDRAAAAATLREANSQLDLDKASPYWLTGKVLLLHTCEQIAQWELADEIEAPLTAELQKQLSKTAASTTEKDPRRQFHGIDPTGIAKLLEFGRLLGFNILFSPDKFSREQRLAALVRVQPRAEQYALAHPDKKAGMYLGIARSQRLLGDANWRDSLNIAQAAAFETVKLGKGWHMLPLIAAEWRLAGDTTNARFIGNETLKHWKEWSPSRLAELKRLNKNSPIYQWQVIDDLIPFVAETLIYSDMPGQAIDTILQLRTQTYSDGARIIQLCAREHPDSPPKQLLALPKAKRQAALREWTNGLVPELTYYDDEPPVNTTRLLPSMLW